MSYMERLISIVRRETERTVRKLHKPPRLGLVSSYDKVNHAVKVKYQPEGTESGWIPLTGHAVGNQWGIASAPNVNDQVLVEFQEGDHQTARIGMRHFSTKNKPPQIEAGEHQFTHSTGSTVYFKKDGTVVIGGASVMPVGQFATGQSGDISTGQQTGETGQSQQQQQNNPPNAKQTITLNPDGSIVVNCPNNFISMTAPNTITLTAPTIALAGVVKVGGSGASIPVSKQGTIDTGGFADISDESSVLLVTG